jgi:hypothetical protein
MECNTWKQVLMNSVVNYSHVPCACSNEMYVFGKCCDVAKGIHCVIGVSKVL